MLEDDGGSGGGNTGSTGGSGGGGGGDNQGKGGGESSDSGGKGYGGTSKPNQVLFGMEESKLNRRGSVSEPEISTDFGTQFSAPSL